MSKTTVGILVVLVVILAAGVLFWTYEHSTNNSQQAWRIILKRCATSNLLGSDVVYFGASNRVGPGSIWRRAADGSYRLFYELSDLEGDDDKRKKLIVQNNDVGCQGDATSDWSLKIGLPFESSAIPLKADVSADLKQARDLKVAITAYAMDELKEGPFEEVIRNNPRLAATPGAFVIAENAIRVTGFEATFAFDEGVASQIRPKYQDHFISLKEGATLNAEWTSKADLKLTAVEPFYVLAGFGNFRLTKNGNQIQIAKTGSVPAAEVTTLASDRTDKSANRADDLTSEVANLDNYHAVVETSVHFGLDKTNLTPRAKAALDQLIANVPNTKGYIVVVEGDTDSVGNAAYNYELGERRAEAVVQYLSEKNIPPHKIYVVGLGKDKSVESNKTAAGRAKNRRVDVRLMSNTHETLPPTQGTAAPSSQ